MNKGFSVLEMLIYVTIVLVILSAIFSVAVSLVKSHRGVKVERNIEESASFALERIVREIRGGDSINLSQSVIGTNPGVLFLNTFDDSGNPKTVKFFVESGVIKEEENGGESAPLTLSQANVSSLIFRNVSGPNSSAIRVEMTVQSGSESQQKSANFYGFAILRGSY